MSDSKHSLWRIYGFAWALTLVILGLVAARGTLADITKVLILAGLEITFSFDNAVVNAKILQRMSRAWQQLFMTVGIAVAVFGVRIVLPLILVALTAHLGPGHVLDLALHHPEDYARQLTGAHALISAFGGMFLLLIFLDFFLEDRDITWLAPIERFLARANKVRHVAFIMALSLLALVGFVIAHHGERQEVIIAGLIGIGIFMILGLLDTLASPNKFLKSSAKGLLQSGLIGFLYLEVIDASFSLDGVIGAFAITTKLLLIAAGLGIGALYVRSLTIHMLRRGTLEQYHYMEHGAHYAIGILALLMLVSIRYNVPELVTGLSGLVVIGAAIAHSHIENKTDKTI